MTTSVDTPSQVPLSPTHGNAADDAAWPKPPDIDGDALLAIGHNMAEAAHPLLFTFAWMKDTPEAHPFYAKLSATLRWLEDEGWRILQDTPAATVRGAEIKASALRLEAADENLRDSLIQDLERLAEEAAKPPALKAAT